MFQPLEVFPAQHICWDMLGLFVVTCNAVYLLEAHVLESLNQVCVENANLKAVQNGVTVVDLPASDFDEPR